MPGPYRPVPDPYDPNSQVREGEYMQRLPGALTRAGEFMGGAMMGAPAVGNVIPSPIPGAAMGSGVGSAIGKLFEAKPSMRAGEYDSLSYEDWVKFMQNLKGYVRGRREYQKSQMTPESE